MFTTTAQSPLSESDRDFLQRRVSSFGLMAGAIFGGFLLFRLILLLAADQAELHGHPSILYHLLATAWFFAIWAATARGVRSERMIRVIEVVGLIAAAGAINMMGTQIPLVGRPDFILLLALSLALTIRAIYVPSSWRRSLILATLVALDSLGAVYWSFLSIDIEAWSHVQPELALFTPESSAIAMVISSAPWWVAITLVTTAASHVIYGLRRDARQAKQLGQYRLDTKLGEGGMGIVFKAHHALLRRPTAVKLLLPEKAGERSIERFEREVRLMSKLRHPNTITVYDYGRSPDGVFYYAMEYIDGATLDSIVSVTGPFEPARALHVLSQAAAAMVEAHGIGLIHRDIKPANVMLFLPHHYGGIQESVKVLDFGLVKELESEDIALTQADSLTGTPQYMAPESIRNPAAVEVRSDIYAFGCLLFYLITGEHLFDGESVMDVCAKHLNQAPDTMSERMGVPVDEQLEALVSACVAKDPDDRPSTAGKLRARLLAIEGLGVFTEHDAEEWWDEYGALFDRELPSATEMFTIDLARARTASAE